MIGIALIALVFGGLLVLILTQKQDNTTPQEIADATARLKQAISEAEDAVGKYAPHNDDCRSLLAQARYCLGFNKNSTRLVVSAWMIKQKREEGVGYANKAAEIALALRS